MTLFSRSYSTLCAGITNAPLTPILLELGHILKIKRGYR